MWKDLPIRQLVLFSTSICQEFVSGSVKVERERSRINIFFLSLNIVQENNRPTKQPHVYKAGCLDQRAEAKEAENLQGASIKEEGFQEECLIVKGCMTDT